MLHGNMESTSFWESHVRNSGISGVAGLLKLISGSEDLEGPQQLALHHLAGLAQELENVLEAETVQLGEIVRGQ